MSILEKTKVLISVKENQKSKEKKEQETQRAADLKNKTDACNSIIEILKTINGKIINKLKIKVVFCDTENNETIAHVYNNDNWLFNVDYNRWLVVKTYFDEPIGGHDFWERGFKITYYSHKRRESMTEIFPFGYQDLATVCEKFEDWVAGFLAES